LVFAAVQHGVGFAVLKTVLARDDASVVLLVAFSKCNTFVAARRVQVSLMAVPLSHPCFPDR
jgi:hypothetical protein